MTENDAHCPSCGSDQLRRDTRPVEYKYDGEQLTVQQPGLYCDRCSEALLEPEDLAETREKLHLLQLMRLSERSASSGLIGLDEAFAE